MKAIILLNYDENTSQIEEEEKLRFLKSILEQMNVPINDFWETDAALDVTQKIRLRSTLINFNIHVLDDLDGNMSIYVDKDIVAEWKKPHYKLKKDLSQLDQKKQLYLEMTIDCNSVFEEQEQTNK